MAPEYSREAFIAGLLHDSGKVILDKFVLERQSSYQKLFNNSDETIVAIETKIFGFDHTRIGGDLCIHWDLPNFVAEAVKFHHFPHESCANMLVFIVHAADMIAKQLDTIPQGVNLDILDSNTLNFLQLEEKKFNAIAHQIVEAVETMEDDTY